MKIIVLGAPGAGKGTQAQKITKHYNIPHISTGMIFRENINDKTELGIKVKEILASGGLVEDDLTNKIVEDRLSKSDCMNGFMLDGYPRNIAQAKSLDDFGISISHVIYIKVDDDDIVERMSGRLTCPKCSETYHDLYNPSKVKNVCTSCGTSLIQRPDDNKETVIKRLELFRREATPILDFYSKRNLVIEVNGLGKPDSITDLIIHELDTLN
jgi:adenylate kinase